MERNKRAENWMLTRSRTISFHKDNATRLREQRGMRREYQEEEERSEEEQLGAVKNAVQ